MWNVALIRRIVVIGCLLSVAQIALHCRGDVLVTKDGKRYVGSVTLLENGKAYTVQLLDGSKTMVAMSRVDRVVSKEAAQRKLGEYLAKADLHNAAHVDYLLRFVDDWALFDERDQLLSRVFELRWAAATGDNSPDLAELRGWCEVWKFEAGLKRCDQHARGIEFRERFAKAQGDAKALAELSIWADNAGLAAEASQAADRAVRLAPDDARLRHDLGYDWDPARGGWIKVVSPWRLTVQGARIADGFFEPGGYSFKAQQIEDRLAIIQVTVQPLSAQDGRLLDCLVDADPDVSVAAQDFLLRGQISNAGLARLVRAREPAAELQSLPCRVFATRHVTLELPGQVRRPVVWTSRPDGYGVTIGDNGWEVVRQSGSEPATLRYFREKGQTLALVVAQGQQALDLVFLVPPNTTGARLRFYRNCPVDVTF